MINYGEGGNMCIETRKITFLGVHYIEVALEPCKYFTL